LEGFSREFSPDLPRVKCDGLFTVCNLLAIVTELLRTRRAVRVGSQISLCEKKWNKLASDVSRFYARRLRRITQGSANRITVRSAAKPSSGTETVPLHVPLGLVR
jgi:hypothetical protein